jgi:dienelactone hydrolase
MSHLERFPRGGNSRGRGDPLTVRARAAVLGWRRTPATAGFKGVRPRPALALSLAVLTLGLAPGRAADSRAEFLKLIDRPRVPLAAEAKEPAIKDGLAQFEFSFSAEAGQRVPGILIKPATGTARRPAVIALHGTGGAKEDQVAFMNTLARAGFVAIAIDGRHHGARSKTGKGSVEYVDALLRTFRTGRELPFFYDTAWDVMRLIDYLETRDDIDPRRIGLFGISKGGIETYLAAAVDPRVAVAVPCIAVESFRWAVENDSWQSRISTVKAAFDAAAKDSGVANPGAEFVHTFYTRVAPGLDRQFDGPAMVPLIAPRPLLAINGDTDPRTPLPGVHQCIDAARPLYRAAGADEKLVLHLQPNTAHKVQPESLVLAKDWFVKWLKP